MKQFTDDDGNKYEIVGEYANPGIVIKPIKKAEEKNRYYFTLNQTEELQLKPLFIWVEDLTESQAQAVAKTIEHVIENITSGSWNKNDQARILNAIEFARSLQEENQQWLRQ